MMNEQIVQMGLMWVLAGLSAGWLAETCISRRGYGLVVDMGLGVGAGHALGVLRQRDAEHAAAACWW